MKKILFGFLFVLLFIVVYSTGQSIIERVVIDNKVKEFIENSEIEYVNSTKTRVFHRVNLHNYHPEFEFHPNEEGNNQKELIRPSDIMINRVGPFETAPKWANDFFGFYFGGHAALIAENDMLYEIIGFAEEPMIDYILYPNTIGHRSFDTTVGVKHMDNYWFDETYTDEFFGLRLKNSTQNDMNNVILNMEETYKRKQLGEGLYNYAIFFNTDTKYYCGDLVARAWNSITPEKNKNKFNLNKDGFMTTQNDMLMSNDAYMYMYYKKVDGVSHYYYL